MTSIKPEESPITKITIPDETNIENEQATASSDAESESSSIRLTSTLPPPQLIIECQRPDFPHYLPSGRQQNPSLYWYEHGLSWPIQEDLFTVEPILAFSIEFLTT